MELDLRAYDGRMAAVAGLEPELRGLDEPALRARALRLREAVGQGAGLDTVEAEAFGLAREAARRALGQRPHDEQVLAGLALHDGHVAEMQTGEGKTLAAVLPAFLNALAGRGLHVLTFNDYLARRDAEWMGPVYALLGLSVAWVQATSSAAQRRAAYAADVTYVTAREAAFDTLRDLLALDPEQVVHRPPHMAIVDEADSLMIDEARIPLVIAGRVEDRPSEAVRLAALVGALEPGLHFDTDAYARDVELTEAGVARLEEALGRGSLHAPENYHLLTEINCALHARVLLRRDEHYIVRGGAVELVDEFTGRVVRDRHWPDGLQAAVEAKEGLERRPDGTILGSLTLHHVLRAYPRLCGMTGTARAAAGELHEMYGLQVVVVPTHRPLRRLDHDDVVFTHLEAKERAIVDEVRRAHSGRRPVLVGTLTVEESERLAARLREQGVVCAVLNARNDAAEAQVVAAAGAAGAVTISTHMAGRGTDIRLGGPDESARAEVVALGGLYVIGTNRHESGRVDLQLRGRAGRQGDPGESRFFVSLEDGLLARHHIHDLLPRRWRGHRQDEPVEDRVVRYEVARAQRIVEGQDREIRRTLARYSEALEQQRQTVHQRRQRLLHELPQPPRHAALAAIDAAWRQHLAFVADVREGIHLVRLGGDDPLTRYRVLAGEAFARMQDEIEAALKALASDPAAAAGPDGLRGPSATWTYLVNDDPFRDQLGSQLTGPGRTTLAMGAAVMATPLLIALGLADRFLRKRPRLR